MYILELFWAFVYGFLGLNWDKDSGRDEATLKRVFLYFTLTGSGILILDLFSPSLAGSRVFLISSTFFLSILFGISLWNGLRAANRKFLKDMERSGSQLIL